MFGVQAWIKGMLGSSKITGAVLVPLDDRLEACNGITNIDGLVTEEARILQL